MDMPLPDDILSCTSLNRLYLGVWRFPETAARPPAFPNLRELGLFHTIIEDRNFDALLAHCPNLEILFLAMAYYCPSRLHITSHGLRVVAEWVSSIKEVVIDDAPCLKRMVVNTVSDQRPIKIVHAPRLEVLGFLDLQLDMLEIGGIAIKAGMHVRASTMVPSLKILAVKVRLSDSTEAKMFSTLLRCFPHLETLHIMSIPSYSADSVLGMKFWESLGSCQCIESHLKTIVFHSVLGQNHESFFLNYILKNGKVLKTVGIICDEGVDVVVETGLMAGSVGEGNAASGRSSGRDVLFCAASKCLSFLKVIDLSVEDPFCVLRHETVG